MSKVFKNVDWELLRAQKAVLVNIAGRSFTPTAEADLLDGLVNFLDHFMDCAAEQLGDETVFALLRQVRNEHGPAWLAKVKV